MNPYINPLWETKSGVIVRWGLVVEEVWPLNFTVCTPYNVHNFFSFTLKIKSRVATEAYLVP